MGKQIVVLGMHRSGTSIVTHLIHQMGAYFGEIDHEMGPNEYNLKGYWERNDVMQLNDAIFQESQEEVSWFRVSNFNAYENTISKDLDERIKEIIDQLGQNAPWVLKDPRMCLTFPYWEKYLTDPVIIIPFRSPVAVARSLNNRDHFPLEFSLALWQEYLTSAIIASKKFPVVYVEYEKLLESPLEESRELFATLSSLGVSGLEFPSELAILNLVDAKLKNATGLVSEEKKYLSKAGYRLLELLREGDQNQLVDFVSELKMDEVQELLQSWEDKIEEIVERNNRKKAKFNATLFSATEKGEFSLRGSVRISEVLSPNLNTLTFPVPGNFEIGNFWKIDLVNDISILNIKSIKVYGKDRLIPIDLNEIEANAFYRSNNWFFFDQIPSSVWFHVGFLPSGFEVEKVCVELNIVNKGIRILPHVNQFHKIFSNREHTEIKGNGDLQKVVALLFSGHIQNSERYRLERQSYKKTISHHLHIQEKLQNTISVQNQTIQKLTQNLIGNQEVQKWKGKCELKESELNRYRNDVDVLRNEVKTLINHKNGVEKNYFDLRNSLSFRIGWTLTMPFRWVYEAWNRKKKE